MFHSATLRLTGWYLLILMSISILFSMAIYHVARGEIGDRLDALQSRLEQRWSVPGSRPFLLQFRDDQQDRANRNILLSLIYVNILILFGGGALSYMLARRTLRQIENAHEAQSRFASDASHELRTPLAAMKSELEVALRDTKISKADMRDLLKSNLEEVNKLTDLSKTLLTLSRMDYGDIELEHVNLSHVAAEVTQRYDKNAKRIQLTLPKDPLLVKTNPAIIEELFTILVDNALKYSPQKSKVTATLARHGKQAKFSITNSGKGIPREKLPYIFDRFYRADESRTAGGSGLGLALAKDIVGLHKGELSVSSATNQDTTFEILLPIIRKTSE